jgi:hypothetical protein
VVHTDNGEVGVRVSHDKWEKTRKIIRKMIDALDEFYICSELGEEPPGIDRKQMESDRGFLIYVAQAYPAQVPYLKVAVAGLGPPRTPKRGIQHFCTLYLLGFFASPTCRNHVGFLSPNLAGHL